jgi:tRNA (adenine37-N6)-methyltransferase
LSITTIPIVPIGFIHSPYLKKYDAPRQPQVDDRVDDAVVELYPHCNYEQALSDLTGIERIWLITWLHQAVGWKPMVQTPRDRKKRGLFSTRSPFRPNPIGMSVVRLVEVVGLKLYVRGTDLLDGTPVIDIKPYLPYADAFPNSETGWVPKAEGCNYVVDWQHVDVELSVKEHVDRVLAFDPFPHPYRRITADSEGGYTLAYKWHRVRFHVVEDTVVIRSITSLDNPS